MKYFLYSLFLLSFIGLHSDAQSSQRSTAPTSGKKVESKMTEKPLHKKSTDIVPGRPDRIDHRMKGPKGEKIYIGSRGGRYYLDASGKRNYVEYKGNKKHK